MENKNVLLDSYCVEGNDINEFFKEVTAMSKRTHVYSVNGCDLVFASEYTGKWQFYNAGGNSKLEQDDGLAFYYLTESNLQKFKSNKGSGKEHIIGAIRKELLTPELVSEFQSEQGTGLLMFCERGEFIRNRTAKNFIISNNSLKTLCQRVGIGGECSFANKKFFRDIYLASEIYQNNPKMVIVYREADGICKLFAAFSSKYTTVNQDILVKVMQHQDFAFKDFIMKSFKIDNFITEAVLTGKPDPATNITPGIIITNSDVGLSGFSIKAVFFVGDSYVIASGDSIKHCKKNLKVKNLLAMFDKAKKTLESSSFIKDMENLKEKKLSICSIESDEICDLFELSEMNTNKKAFVEEVIRTVYDKKIMSIKQQDKASSKIDNSLAVGKEYSYFEFATKVIAVSSMFTNLDDFTNLMFHENAYNVPKIIDKLIQ